MDYTTDGNVVPASEEVLQTMDHSLSVNLILLSLGLLCALLNAPLLYVLIALKKLRGDSKLLICLEIADIVNCLALSSMGFTRYLLYNRAISQRLVPLETSLSCASKPLTWLRVIGSIWPSTVQLIMSIERVIATACPIAYTKHWRHRALQLCFASIIFVISFCGVGLVLAISNVSNGYVKLDCGRRATFSKLYAQSIYWWEMLGYDIGFVLNIFAYLKAKSMLSSTSVRYQLKRTRICLALGALSAVLVSVMDVKSLFLSDLTFVEKNQLMFHLYNCAGVIKSSMNIFIYTWLHKEFRHELFSLYRYKYNTILNCREMRGKIAPQGEVEVAPCSSQTESLPLDYPFPSTSFVLNAQEFPSPKNLASSRNGVLGTQLIINLTPSG